MYKLGGHGGWETLAEGDVCTIVAVVVGGRCPTTSFLAELDVRARAQLHQALVRLAMTGRLRNPEEFRPLMDGKRPVVYEVKAHHGPGFRVYAIRSGDYYLVTHGRKKPKDGQVKLEISRARRIIHDWEQGI